MTATEISAESNYKQDNVQSNVRHRAIVELWVRPVPMVEVSVRGSELRRKFERGHTVVDG